jgi:phage gp36-like protein
MNIITTEPITSGAAMRASVQNSAGDYFNPSTAAFDTVFGADITTHTIAGTEPDSDGCYRFVLPNSGSHPLPAGDDYVIKVRQLLAATVLKSTAVEAMATIDWDGTDIDPQTGGGVSTGPGADAILITITNSTTSLPVADADVWITSDAGGQTVIAGTLQTDSSGQITFMLDDGSGYYLWMQKDGVNSIEAEAFEADAADGNDFTTTTATAASDDSYVTQAYMETVRGSVNIRKWSNKGGSQSTVDIDAVNAARADSTLEINGILMKRYTIPLVNTSATDVARLRKWAERIASYLLYIGRGLQEDDPTGNQLRTEYSDTIAEVTAFADPSRASNQSLDAEEISRALGHAPRLVV